MLNHSSRGTSTPHKCTTQSQVLMRLLICLHSIRQSQEICEHTKTKWSRINFIQNVSLIRKVPFQRHVTQVISSLRKTGPKKKRQWQLDCCHLFERISQFKWWKTGNQSGQSSEKNYSCVAVVLILISTYRTIRNKCFVWKLTSQINKLV